MFHGLISCKALGLYGSCLDVMSATVDSQDKCPHICTSERLQYPLKSTLCLAMVLDVHKGLVAEIDRFLAETGMGPTYFGRRAAGNSEVVARLKAGRTITGVTEKKIRDFMAERRRECA